MQPWCCFREASCVISVIESLLIREQTDRPVLVVLYSLPVTLESDNVDRLSRVQWSRSHDSQPNTEQHSFSLQSKLEAVENELHSLDTRFVRSFVPVPS